ncbi:MAG: LacI family DNA-binding transcriptional regulator [Trueperaceae bacterium]|nr:LacI family DNA-binding transcriptional regulator [Trueperaceae bacterium]
MAATIDDVAKKAAVSTATVSRALRGLPNVAPATRDHILKIAKELHYVVSPRASRVNTGHKLVAVLTPLVDQWFYSKITTAIVMKLLEAGYEAVRIGVDGVRAQTEQIKRTLHQGLVDAVIVVSYPLEGEAIKHLQMHQIPCVTVESHSEVFPSIEIDNTAAAELAMRHLINLGHRRIGFITPMETFEGEVVSTSRLKGYRLALEKAGIAYDEVLELSGNDVYEGGVEAMKRLYSLEKPPTAVFAASDEMAVGALKTLRDLNVKVPEHVSVIGFDDNDLAHYIGLTTIRQPVTLFGELAAEHLIDCFEGLKESCREHTILPFEIVLRNTTGRVFAD